jgi:hypothetical protein
MADFEVMPIGTRDAMKETAMLLRQYEAHHRAMAERQDVNGERITKAERNRVAAERLEVLLGVPDPRTVPAS